VSCLKKKVTSLQTVVDKLKNNSLVNDRCVELLEKTYSGVPLEMMKRICVLVWCCWTDCVCYVHFVLPFWCYFLPYVIGVGFLSADA
jgi:hypothetical protein